MDYYTLLGLNRDATVEQIKSAYRRAQKAFHQDAGAQNDYMSKKINEAYTVLSDPEKRAAYDSRLASGGPGGFEDDSPRNERTSDNGYSTGNASHNQEQNSTSSNKYSSSYGSNARGQENNSSYRERMQEEKYTRARRVMEASASFETYMEAYRLFDELGSYRDASNLASKCREKAYAIKLATVRAEAERLVADKRYQEALRLIEEESLAWELKDITCICQAELEKKNKRTKKAVRIIFALAILGLLVYAGIKQRNVVRIYNEAEAKLEAGDYRAAMYLYKQVANHRNSTERIQEARYRMAGEQLDKGDYTGAALNYEDLGSYRDSADMLVKAKYGRARQYLESKDIDTAYDAFSEISDYGDSQDILSSIRRDYSLYFDLLECEKGDILELGEYYFFDGESKAPIQWVVLGKEEGRVLLLSKECLDAKLFDEGMEENGDTCWKDSTIREWLNSEFLAEAFTPLENEGIAVTRIEEKGKGSNDRIFLLSKEEKADYLGNGEKGRAIATPYALSLGAPAYEDSPYTAWGLRSRGLDKGTTAVVNLKGDTFSGDFLTSPPIANEHVLGVRPALWMDIKQVKESYKK